MATTFAKSGADVALLARTESEVSEAAEALAAATGRLCRGYACDVANASEIGRTFALVHADFGEIDILVNNAGVALPNDFLSYSSEDFDRVLDVNLKGPFIATQRAAQSMKDHRIAGAIVNMSSINADVAIANIPAYCASKGGINQITKAAALALAMQSQSLPEICDNDA